MKTRTFIVLIPVEGNLNARKQCESIEYMNIKIGGSVQATANDVRAYLVDGIHLPNDIEVEPITDFMDRCNNEEFNVDNYFMSYVLA